MSIREEQASTIGELIEVVSAIASAWRPSPSDSQELWFRGQSAAAQGLLPALYRPEIAQLNYDETAILERFKLYATPYVQRLPSNDWDWYFLAQHYGMPTRLLDWSESLLAALYFSLCKTVPQRGRLRIDADVVAGRLPSLFDDQSPAVWVLDAGTLNKAATGEDEPFFPVGPLTQEYLPEGMERQVANNRQPLALLATRANERLTAQQGAFTIHGHDRMPLELLLAVQSGTIQIARVAIDRANLSHLWNDLEVAGVSELSLFPGVDTAASHVRWVMQSVKKPTRA